VASSGAALSRDSTLARCSGARKGLWPCPRARPGASVLRSCGAGSTLSPGVDVAPGRRRCARASTLPTGVDVAPGRRRCPRASTLATSADAAHERRRCPRASTLPGAGHGQRARWWAPSAESRRWWSRPAVRRPAPLAGSGAGKGGRAPRARAWGQRAADPVLARGPAGPGPGRRVRVGVLRGSSRGQHGQQGGHLLGGRLTADQPQRRWGRLVGARVRVAAHSGMFPCFFGGRVSRLVRSARSALVTFIRVLLGVITVSM